MSWPDDDPPLPEREGYSPRLIAAALGLVLLVCIAIGYCDSRNPHPAPQGATQEDHR